MCTGGRQSRIGGRSSGQDDISGAGCERVVFTEVRLGVNHPRQDFHNYRGEIP